MTLQNPIMSRDIAKPYSAFGGSLSKGETSPSSPISPSSLSHPISPSSPLSLSHSCARERARQQDLQAA